MCPEDESDQTPDSPSDVLWGWLIVTEFGVAFYFCLACLYGAIFRAAQPSTGEFVVVTLLAIYFAAMFVAHAGMRWRRPWANRLFRWLAPLGVLGLFLAIVVGSLSELFFGDVEPGPKPVGEATWLILLLFWAGFGLLWMIGTLLSRERQDPDEYSTMLMWPALVFLMDPLVALFLLILLGGPVLCGEWIGHRFGHPRIGALIGLMIPLAAAFGYVVWPVRQEDKETP